MDMKSSLTRDSLQHLRLMVDLMPSALAYVDRDLHCLFANQTLAKWLCKRAEGIVGMNVEEMFGTELFSMNKPHIDAALRGEEQLFESFIQGPDGNEIYGISNYIPDVVDDKVFGFLVNVTDISDLRRAELALHREQALRSEIERHAERLKTLLSERNQILDVLAHEIRQPLHTASATLEGVASALVKATRNEPSSGVTRAQNVLGEVMATVDNTLAVASLLVRDEPVEILDTDLDTLIGLAIADMPASDRTRIRVVRDTQTRTASMDINLMRLALRNLLSNALKYSVDPAPVTLRVSDSDDPLALIIDVEDHGCGMDAELLPRLFERGSRGRSAVSKPGQGLGLFIVRRIMNLHAGSVVLLRNTQGGITMRLVIEQAHLL